MACAKVVDGDEDAEGVQFGKQLVRGLVRDDELPLGRSSTSLIGLAPEGVDEVPAILHQAQILAVTRADVEPEVKSPGSVSTRGARPRAPVSSGAGHGHDEAALLRHGDEAIRRIMP